MTLSDGGIHPCNMGKSLLVLIGIDVFLYLILSIIIWENGSEMGCFSLFLKTVQYISTTLIYINNNNITFNTIQQ